jgi:D-sedoheptulose 7-phosphate isomerase
MPLYRKYTREIAETLDLLPQQEIHNMVQTLHNARLAGRQVFVIGNGGSASTASHLACDLNKNTVFPGYPRFKVHSLGDNVALMSALSNDLGYEYVFSEQLANLMNDGDILIAISTSGNSPNVLKAVELANRQGVYTIGWTGYAGGKLAQMVSLSINVPNHCVEQIEDIHLILAHMITVALRNLAQNEFMIPMVIDAPLLPA